MIDVYQEYTVKNSIAYFVKKLWILDNPANCPPIFHKGVPPNGCFTIAIVKGNGLNIQHQGKILHLPEGIYFCGQITSSLYIDIYSGTKATMIQLFPWTPVHFGISDAYLFTDKICPFIEVTGASLLDLSGMVELSNERLCYYITKAFYPLFRNTINTALIINSTQMIIANKGNLEVSAIALSLNCSVRHLQIIFKKYIGISPKALLRIIKLREALDEIVYPDIHSGTMTELATTNGYYDQPHFNNEFAALLRTTPKKFNKADYLLTLKK